MALRLRASLPILPEHLHVEVLLLARLDDKEDGTFNVRFEKLPLARVIESRGGHIRGAHTRWAGRANGMVCSAESDRGAACEHTAVKQNGCRC